MKKIIIILLLAVSFGIPTFINAIDKFPEEIYVYSISDGVYRKNVGKYNIGMAAKNAYYIENGQKVFFKVICTTYNRSAPEKGSSNNLNDAMHKYVKMAWNGSSKEKNMELAIGVGTIIAETRKLSGGMSWDEPNNNYFLAEVAINEFLYENGNKHSVNKINKISNIPDSVMKKIKKLISYGENKVKEYNDINTSKVIIDDFKINDKKVTSVIESSDKYVVRATIKCQDNKGKNIACSKLTYKLNLTIDDKTREISLNKQKNGNTLKIKGDITSYVKADKNIKLELIATNSADYDTAQRYKRKNNPESTQAMTANMLRNQAITKQGKHSATFKVNEIKPPVENTCEGDLEKQQKTLSELYSVYHYINLLDVTSPSCSDFDNEKDLGCKNSTMTIKKVADIQVNEGTYKSLCTFKFKLENGIFDYGFSSSDELIYSTVDGVVANANFSYDCNIPDLKDSTQQTAIELVNKSSLVPKLVITMPWDNGEYELLGSIKNADSELNEDGYYYCMNYNDPDKGYGCALNGTIEYKYSKKDSKQITGIKVPSSIKDGDYNTKIQLKEGVLGTETLETDCPFEIKTEPKKAVKTKSILYRSIDVNAPFLKYSGETRKTGENWCNNATTSEEIPTDENTNVTACRFYGDVNGDDKWDDTDIKLIQRYVNREVGLIFTDEQKKYADCNHDGLITINDATLISKYITYNDKYLKGDANFDGILDSDDILVLQNIISQGESSIQFEPLRKNIASFLNGCEESFNINAITRMQTYISNIDNDINAEDIDVEAPNAEDGYIIENGTKSSQLDGECDYNNNTVKTYITNRPNSNGVYNGKKVNQPLYVINLTASDIKRIRADLKDNDTLDLDSYIKSGYCQGNVSNCDVSKYLESLK